jgi:hypothetical protein
MRLDKSLLTIWLLNDTKVCLFAEAGSDEHHNKGFLPFPD